MKIKCWNVFFSHLRQMHFLHSFLDLFHYSNCLKCSQVLNLCVCVHCVVMSCNLWKPQMRQFILSAKKNANDARLNCQKVMEKNERMDIHCTYCSQYVISTPICPSLFYVALLQSLLFFFFPLVLVEWVLY